MPRPGWIKETVPCTRCGRHLEKDPRRAPQFCRDCKDTDPDLYRAWKHDHATP